MSLGFAITWDYRCPFARNAHDHVIEGLLGGADWDVTFLPFSLSQVHVGEGEPDIWDDPQQDSGLLAMQVGVVVRDAHPDRFLAVHRELFDVRHRHGQSLRDRDLLADLLDRNGIDPEAVFAQIATGAPLGTVQKEHERAALDHEVWGVPTFIFEERAVFVRLMQDAGGDVDTARMTVERIMGLLIGWPDLNEFKHTTRKR
jgi:hypothetical protein